MQIDIKQVKTSELKINQDNPRTISIEDMKLLTQSLIDFPDMLQLREIVVDEDLICLGGNMRLLALRGMGIKSCIAKIVTGLTHDQKREFIIKDNSFFGEWNMDDLEKWHNLPLKEWGVKLPKDWLAAIPEDNKDIDELEFENTKHECSECGFKW